jgi:proline iminopeptidase
MMRLVPFFTAYDGTKLAYHVLGEGTPLICLPGGPMQASAYLGDLGGPSVKLIMLDLRGTGDSETPADSASYRCDRLVADVEALREHLGLDTMNLLGHSAGTNLAVSYAARYPERVNRLLLLNPSTFAVGINATAELRREVVQLREGEPWFEAASAAFERIAAGQGSNDDWAAIAPCRYARWDAAAQAHHAGEHAQRNNEAAAIFATEGAFDPPAIRAALANLDAPVMLIAGEFDIAAPPRIVAEYVRLFGNVLLSFVVLPGGGHFPWLDDPAWLARNISEFVDPPGSR